MLTRCLSADARIENEDDLAAIIGDTRLYELRLGYERPRACELPSKSSGDASPVNCTSPRLTDRQLERLTVLLQRGTETATANNNRTKETSAREVFAARVELLLVNESHTIDQTINRLNALLQTTHDSTLLNDLAVAHTIRAAAHNNPGELFRALDLIEHAAARDSTNAFVHFNRAILLERLHLFDASIHAWAVYLKVEANSEWRAEGERRRAGMLATISSQRRAAENLNGNVQRMREAGVERLVPAWAQAWRGGESDSANAILEELQLLGERLSRANGDYTLTDAQRAIADTSVDQRAIARMAQGIAEYKRGLDLFKAAHVTAAANPLAEAREKLRGNIALEYWPAALLGAVRLYSSDFEGAERIYGDLIARVDSMRYPAASARAWWGLGLVQVRQGHFERALDAYAHALRTFERIGEFENSGAMRLLIAEAESMLGWQARSHASYVHALEELAPAPASSSRHNLLTLLGRELSDAGLTYAAIAVHREGARTARLTGRTKDPVEALARLARAEIAAGEHGIAAQHVAQARTLADSVSDPVMLDWMTAEIAQAESELYLQNDPSKAAAALTAAVDRFSERNLPLSLLPTLGRRAFAYMRMQDTARAHEDLTRAIAILQRETTIVTHASDRARLLETANSVFDALIALYSARGQHINALATLEAMRMLVTGQTAPMELKLAQFGAQQTPEHGKEYFARLQRKLPRDVAVLEYAVLPDRLLTWAIRADTITTAVLPIGERALTGMVEEFESAVQFAGRKSEVQATSRRLSAQLITPLMPVLNGMNELVIVPDKSLQRVPFAALLVPSSDEFLIERYALRTTASARLAVELQEEGGKGAERAAHTNPGSAARKGSLLLIGDPAFDRTVFPDLPRLPGSLQEIDAIGSVYSGAELLRQERATAKELLRRLPYVEMLHFAGHARFRDDQAGRSYLVMAADHEGQHALYAQDLENLRLPSLRLVVLSACETLTSGRLRTGGFDAFARAFLNAGAHGVVGSLWRIDDRATARFMPVFHRARVDGKSNAQALRAMQIEMIRSGEGRFAAPSAWAAFRLEES